MIDLRDIPAPVIERLGDAWEHRSSGYRRNADVVSRNRVLEARSARIEHRSATNGDPIFDGYATVYGYPYDVWGGPDAGGWTEVMVDGVFSKTLRDGGDVTLLVDHEGIPLATTKSGTLALASDRIGLRVSTPNGLDMRSPFVQTIASAMERGDVDEMSLAFRAIRQEWNDDYTERRVIEAQLFDVTIATAYPANPAAVGQLRTEKPQPPAAPAMSLAYARALADQTRLRA